jgi:hypothetical protein
MLPFSRTEFIEVFAQYNLAIWPAQILAYALGIAMVASLWRRSRASDIFISGGLAAMWLWTGIAYQWMHFASINPAAIGFGAMFVLQGVLFAFAAGRKTLHFESPSRNSAWAGMALVIYAAVLYPLLGWLAGHEYPAMPMFGIAPCPVVIFTFGMLLLATSHVSRWLLIVPAAWSLIGGSAAFLLGIPQDWLLLFSGLTVLVIVLQERRTTRRDPRVLATRRHS